MRQRTGVNNVSMNQSAVSPCVIGSCNINKNQGGSSTLTATVPYADRDGSHGKYHALSKGAVGGKISQLEKVPQLLLRGEELRVPVL